MGWAVRAMMTSEECAAAVEADLRRNPPDTSASGGVICEAYNGAHDRYLKALRELRMAEANALEASLKFNRAADALYGRMIERGQL